MKHAGEAALRTLAPLLEKLRAIPGLIERKPGIFYFRSGAFLHFHEDAAGIFVDVKLDGKSFERRLLRHAADRAELLNAVSAALAGRNTSKANQGACR